MDDSVRLSRAIKIVKNKLVLDSFDLNNLSFCFKNGWLELLLELNDPEVILIKSRNKEDASGVFIENIIPKNDEPSYVHMLKGKVLAQPIGDYYDLNCLVPEELTFKWNNTEYKLWYCKQKDWVISRSDLESWINNYEPNWSKLMTGGTATIIVGIWEEYWKAGNKSIPHKIQPLIQFVKEADPIIFPCLSVKGSTLFHSVDKPDGWGIGKLDQSWKGVLLKHQKCFDDISH